VDQEGKFAPNLEWLVANQDPQIVCHPVILLLTDMVWSKVASRTFLYNKSWFLFTLIVFLLSQSILEHINEGNKSLAERSALFGCRIFIYLFSMGVNFLFHVKSLYLSIRKKDFSWYGVVPVPVYLENWQDSASLLLTVLLILMVATEPIFHCVGNDEGNFTGSGLFTEECPEAKASRFSYSVFSMCAMAMYYVLLTDMSVYHTRISAFVLVCFRVLMEVILFLIAVAFITVTFSAAISALSQKNEDFQNIPTSFMTLAEICLGMYAGSHYEELKDDPVLMIAVVVYLLASVIFLLNLLIAQLNCGYMSTYKDMLGFARLNRGKIIVECMPSVSHSRWDGFLTELALDSRIEFNEGDVGLAGGVQVMEVSSLNPTTQDRIRRFGGSTSPAMQWPEEDLGGENDEEERFDRLERVVEKAIKRLGQTRKGGGGKGKAGSGTGSAGHTGSNSAGHTGSESEHSSGQNDAEE